MSASATTKAELWAEVLPPDRDFVALPSRRDPVVIAERDPQVLAYVRRTLLSLPPRTGVPAMAERATLSAAGQLLRIPAAWVLLPRPSRRAARPGAQRAAGSWLQPGERRVLVLHHSRDVSAGVVILLFDPGAVEPCVALKVADTVAGADRIRRERVRLERIRRLPLDGVLPTIPAPLPRRESSRFAVLETSAQPGVPMLVAYHRPGHIRAPQAVRADFDAAAAWLAGLQARPTGASEPLRVPDPCEEAATSMLKDGAVAKSSEVVEALADLRRRLRRHTAFQTPVHGDFWPGNTLTRDRRITGVVDWELAETVGSPVRDLARFAVAYSLYLDRHAAPGRAVRGHPGLLLGAPGAGVLYALNGDGWYPALVQHYLRDGLTRLGVPAEVGRDAMQAEVAANAAEASEPAFACALWSLFLAIERSRP